MRCTLPWLIDGLLVLALLLCGPAILAAAEGDPMAVRSWPNGAISLETHWGLHVVVNPPSDRDVHYPRPIDQVIRTTQTIDHVLFRRPNELQPSWHPISEVDQLDANAIQVKSCPLGVAGKNSLVLQVDGVKIVVVPSHAVPSQGELDAGALANASLCVLLADASTRLADPRITRLVASIRPKVVLLKPAAAAKQMDLTAFQAAIGADDRIRAIDHNTLAISQSVQEWTNPRIVTLTESPWRMPDELDREFAAMEQACRASQDVFAKLSTNQLNFKPANGTHTPRWNTEHMMGRQLLFFSQIYHTHDPLIPVMDVNPRQMPEDYMFAHPDWTGMEEARQMQRTSDFTRRFAYLLAEVELNEQAPGSNWPSLQALLIQMQRHYSEHTANTIKKFDLPEWPTE